VKAADLQIRRATSDDAPVFGRMLQAFNDEFESESPDADSIARRAVPLLERGEIDVLFVGAGPDGFAQIRFLDSLYSDGFGVWLEELYVVPAKRGTGLGRALLDAAMALSRERGADHMSLTTSVDDTAARALYEQNGFTNQEDVPGGPSMLYYERAL